MSFISSTNGKDFLAGHFLLDDEECLRLTKTIPADHAQVVTRENGTKYVPAGAVYPTNDASAIGFVYEDIDVTDGAMPGSVVVKGTVVEDKLPAAVAATAKPVLKDITFVATTPAITRPY